MARNRQGSADPSLASSRRKQAKRISIYEVPSEYNDEENPRTKKRRIERDASFEADALPTIGGSPELRALSNEDVGSLVDVNEEDDSLGVNAPASHADKENKSPPGSKPPSKRRKRKSIGQQSLRKKKRPSNDALVEDSGRVTASSQPPDVEIAESDEEVVAEASPATSPPAVSTHTAVTPQSAIRAAKPTRRKRKSIVLRRKKRRSSSEQNPKTVAKEYTTRKPASLRPNGDQGQDPKQIMLGSEVSAEEETAAFSRIKCARRSRIVRSVSHDPELPPTSPVRRDLDQDEEEDQTYVDEDQSPEPQTPAPTRLPRKHTSNSNDTRNDSRRKADTSGRPKAYDILTYRFTNEGGLPTIAEEDPLDELEDDHELNSALLTDRAPNALDVLAQNCRELITEAMGHVVQEVKGGLRKVVGIRKRSALQAFGQELDNRLFDMSAALENRLTLEGRLRKSRRQHAELEARWIGVRREREEIALRTDAVRKQHWESEAGIHESHELSRALHEVEISMERDTTPGEPNIEYMIHDAATMVSNKAGGSLLERVKAFNQDLEALAAKIQERT